MNPFSLAAKVARRIGTRILRSRNYSSYAAQVIYDSFCDDFVNGCRMPVSQRWWAYRHGFLGKTVVNSRISPDNYRDYLPDFGYYKLHPINQDCRRWIDDKLTLRYVLQPFAQYLPKYYFELQSPAIFRLMDCPGDIQSTPEGVARLLDQEQELAVKPLMGAGGEGFYRLARPLPRSELGRFLLDRSGYVITEFLAPHPQLREVYPNTTNSVRLSVLHEPGSPPRIIGAFAKFGTSRSGAVDNVVAGGIFCGVQTATGELFEPGRYENGHVVATPIHPDTKVPIRGTLPHWNLVTSRVLEICDYIPQLEWLGFDIVITEQGFKILEINSHQSSDILQQHHPILRDPQARRYFHRAMAAKGIAIPAHDSIP